MPKSKRFTKAPINKKLYTAGLPTFYFHSTSAKSYPLDLHESSSRPISQHTLQSPDVLGVFIVIYLLDSQQITPSSLFQYVWVINRAFRENENAVDLLSYPSIMNRIEDIKSVLDNNFAQQKSKQMLEKQEMEQFLFKLIGTEIIVLFLNFCNRNFEA